MFVGGYYDCYWMNLDFDEVVRDFVVGNIDFFCRILKWFVIFMVGLMWVLNFYYCLSNV